MNIIEPYAKMLPPPSVSRSGDVDFTLGDGMDLLRRIEWCARISHRSEDAEPTTERFLRSVVLGHGDWSVVEHASVSVDFYVDRAITHEMVRHRIASVTQECVSGDTRLTGNLTIKEAYERNLVGKKIRSSNGEQIVPNRISHIFYKGFQPVYQVVTKGGYRIKATLAHEFQIPMGEFVQLGTICAGDMVMVNGRPCLLAIDDEKLGRLFFNDGLNAAEISKLEDVPYNSVTRRLRQLGVFRDYRNDKNKEKYNNSHTAASYEKMRDTVIAGYRHGRSAWNSGISQDNHPSVAKQGDSLRKNHHDNQRGELNSNWKGGVAKTRRMDARRLKAGVLACEVCLNPERLEVHHIDEEPANNLPENLVKLCHGCHKKVHSRFRVGVKPISDEIVSILYVGMERVFDLEMQTHHNYVADGFVVHNSTRFVNYEKKMPPSFVYPVDESGNVDTDMDPDWVEAIEGCERGYKKLLAKGWKPQRARSVFPNGLGSRIVETMNLRSWRHFLLMRTTREAHPQMREVTIPLLAEFQEKIPILFEDIEPLARQVDNLKKGR